MELNQDEVMVFDIYFPGVVSMAHCHPGAGRSNGYGQADKLSLLECADLTLAMIELRREVMQPGWIARRPYNGGPR